jgi:hypothetical protein
MLEVLDRITSPGTRRCLHCRRIGRGVLKVCKRRPRGCPEFRGTSVAALMFRRRLPPRCSRGKVEEAIYRAELLLCFAHARRAPPQRHLAVSTASRWSSGPGRSRSSTRWRWTTAVASVGGILSRITVSVSVSPSRRLPAAAGWLFWSWPGEIVELGLGSECVVGCRCSTLACQSVMMSSLDVINN